ncbi:hypothetical protein ACFL52_02615 [Candidatus Margulisiibacteriota bacterium]
MFGLFSNARIEYNFSIFIPGFLLTSLLLSMLPLNVSTGSDNSINTLLSVGIFLSLIIVLGIANDFIITHLIMLPLFLKYSKEHENIFDPEILKKEPNQYYLDLSRFFSNLMSPCLIFSCMALFAKFFLISFIGFVFFLLFMFWGFLNIKFYNQRR